MGRVYTVTINGRTLESRDLKELLARAVTAKRNMGRDRMFRPRMYSELSTGAASDPCVGSEPALVH